MKNNFLILILLFSISSCSVQYVPSPAVVFGNEEKGDVMVEAKFGAMNQGIAGGYAVTDNLNVGLAANFQKGPEVSVNGVITDEEFKGIEPQLILGYYNRIASNTVVEVNAGGGPLFLQSSADDLSNYYKLFLQPTISTRSTNGIIQVNTAVKASYFSAKMEVPSLIPEVLSEYFLEPNVQLNIGKEFMFTTQLGYSFPISSNNLQIEYSPFILNMGVKMQIHKRNSSILP